MRQTEALRRELVSVAGKAHDVAVALAFAAKEPTRPDARTVIYSAPPRDDEDPVERQATEAHRARFPAEASSWMQWFDSYHQEERLLRPRIGAALALVDQAAPELDDPSYTPLERPSLKIKRCLSDLNRLIPSPRIHGDYPPVEIVKALNEQRERISVWIEDLGFLLESEQGREREAKTGAKEPISAPPKEAPSTAPMSAAMAVAGSYGMASPKIDTNIRVGGGQLTNRPTLAQVLVETRYVIDLARSGTPAPGLLERTHGLQRWVQQDREWRHTGFDTVSLEQLDLKLRELKDRIEKGIADGYSDLRKTADDLERIHGVLTREVGVVVGPTDSGPLTRRVPASQEAGLGGGTTLPPSNASPNVFRLHGESWDISFADQSISLKSTVGLRLIHKLLQSQGRRIDLDRVVSMDATEDGSVARSKPRKTMEDEAIAELRTSVRETAAELEQAREYGDLAAQERLQRELRQIQEEIVRAVGLGNRPRPLAGDPDEGTRSRCGMAIIRALRKIADKHELLFRHLDGAILDRSGQNPGYVPKEPVTWLLC